jgi:hypothetical protein
MIRYNKPFSFLVQATCDSDNIRLPGYLTTFTTLQPHYPATHGYPATQLPGYRTTQHRDYLATRLPDYPATRLPDYPPGYSATWLPEYTAICPGSAREQGDWIHTFIGTSRHVWMTMSYETR